MLSKYDDRLAREIAETERFIAFLRRTERDKAIDEHTKTPACMHVLEDFAVIAPNNDTETLQHLNEVNKKYKEHREHALSCNRCRAALDAILCFKGTENLHLFPEKIRKILKLEGEYGKGKWIYVAKLPAPSSGTFSSLARLVYVSRLPVESAIEEFEMRIREPLKLRGLGDFTIHLKKSPGGVNYFQADTHHKREHSNTYLNIRSLRKRNNTSTLFTQTQPEKSPA